MAIADYNEAIALEKTFAPAYSNRGIVYAEKGNYELAIADFSSALQLHPGFVTALYNRAIAQGKLGRYQQAIEDLREALRIEPENPILSNEMAWILLRSNKPAAGLEYVDLALRLAPNYANAYDTRGAIYEALGDRKRAALEYEKALSIDASLTSSQQGLKRLAR